MKTGYLKAHHLKAAWVYQGLLDSLIVVSMVTVVLQPLNELGHHLVALLNYQVVCSEVAASVPLPQKKMVVLLALLSLH